MVGDEDLVARIAESGGGGLAFDKAIATPDMMPRLSKVGWEPAGCCSAFGFRRGFGRGTAAPDMMPRLSKVGWHG